MSAKHIIITTNLDSIAKQVNKEWNAVSRSLAAACYLELCFCSTMHCSSIFMQLIDLRLHNKFVKPIFDGKTYNQNLMILMGRKLANVIVKKSESK